MPSVIPYDPSLVLGSLVHKETLDKVEKIGAIRADVDKAEDKLNDLITLQRSLDMTIQEVLNLAGKVPKDLSDKAASLVTDIGAAATSYATIKLKSLVDIDKIPSIKPVHDDLESPIDYNKSAIKSLPISADSLKLNAQYFSHDENQQNSGTTAAKIGGFVSASFDWLGDEVSAQATSNSQEQVHSQTSRHTITGTLVVCVSCTHKSAQLFAPLIIDVDKAIRVWNAVYDGDTLDFDSDNVGKSLADIMKKKSPNSLKLISGATYGSCFVGMVHVLNTSSTMASETMVSLAESLQAQFSVNSWFTKASGGFGVDSSFSNDVKNLLSSQSISSHCSLTAVGSIPSIHSNEVKLAVQQFAKFDGKESMDQLAALQNATATDKDTIDNSAQAARTGQQMIALKNAQIKGVLEGLSTIDDGANKILDINSMMTALDDYIQKAIDGKVGVPINYYLKYITKAELAQMWVNKYFAGKFMRYSSTEGEEKAAPTTPNT